MDLLSRRSKYWQVVQQARAEFVINSIRERLPESSLWHEKRFSSAQLESLCIVSTGGVYYVDTFDATAREFPNFDDLTIIDGLAIRVRHDTRSHASIGGPEVQQLIHIANAEFNTALEEDRDSNTGVFNRVTCTIDFRSPTDNVEQSGRQLLDVIADTLGFQLSHVPYIANEIWLPTSDLYNIKPRAEYGSAAGEFVFEQPLSADSVTQLVQSFLQSTRSLRAPGIHGTIPSVDYLQDIHMVGRRY